MREQVVGAVEGSLGPVLTPAQAERWSLLQDCSLQILRGDVRVMELGLDPANLSDRLRSHWAASYDIDGDAEDPELATLPQRFLEEATSLLARYADDDAALRALSRDEQAELRREMLRVQVAYEEEARRLGASPSATPAGGRKRQPATLIRFRYGRGSGLSAPLLVAF